MAIYEFQVNSRQGLLDLVIALKKEDWRYWFSLGQRRLVDERTSPGVLRG
jgi:hypothetical protein